MAWSSAGLMSWHLSGQRALEMLLRLPAVRHVTQYVPMSATSTKTALAVTLALNEADYGAFLGVQLIID